ncbi:hypothetical protein [Bacteroides acidifaciens]|uniref:hypothetical protein n=1 Tax=Bacteroides acidifaciens TaxID=85831 RepID=UPI003014FA62
MIKVSTAGMAVSLITDLRFPTPGQQGHGRRIIQSEFQDGATYPQIKEYVLEHTGLKVSNLYISQIKRKCGIEVGKNYNLPKAEDSGQPQCPPEKEKAIREAFKYFGMI